MGYPVKYLISFACALLLFFIFYATTYLVGGSLPVLNPVQWILKKSALDLFLNLFTTQILAVMFTFAFWTENKEVRRWQISPFSFVLRVLLLFAVLAVLSYSLKESIGVDLARQLSALEENDRTLATFKTENLKLQAQKTYLEQRLREVPKESEEHIQLQWQYYQVLSWIVHLYSRYVTIEDSAEIQENIRVSRAAVALNEPKVAVSTPLVRIPFTNLTQEELASLSQAFEERRDYTTALYLVRLLRDMYPYDSNYVRSEERLVVLLNDPTQDETIQEIRSTFGEKQKYFLDFKAGRKLSAFYGIQDFLKRYPEESDAEELYKRLYEAVQKDYVFEEDIMDSFEMGGARSFFFLNKDSDAYKEYLYLGKIVQAAGRVAVRDIAIFQLHPVRGLVAYLTVPYATFDSTTNSLVFDVIDSTADNPYLALTIKRGQMKTLPTSWQVNYSLESLASFSLTHSKDLSDLSLRQVWEAAETARRIGNKEQVSILFYEIFERLLAPLGFIFISLWLSHLSLKYPITGQGRWFQIGVLVASVGTIGTLFDFVYCDAIALFTCFFVNNIFGVLIVTLIMLLSIGWIVLGFIDSLRKRVL